MRTQLLALFVAIGALAAKASGPSYQQTRASRHASLATLAARSSQRSNAVARSGSRGRSHSHLRADGDNATSDGSEYVGVASDWTPEFHAPRLTPRQFLFLSSPSQTKIVYTELKNFKTKSGRTYPLVDSGLSEPCGISFDRERGHLYVADKGVQKIYRFSIVVDHTSDGWSLSTEGPRLTIMSGRQAEWVEVNVNGDVFYSDVVGNSINKIRKSTIDAIATGDIAAESLSLISEKQQEATSAAQTSASLTATGSSSGSTSSEADANIYSMYEGSINVHVDAPAGVASDGVRLFWANQQNAETSGAAVRGEVDPESPIGLAPGGNPAPFPAYALSNNSGVGYGVAKTSNLVFFASQQTSGAGVVYGVSQDGGTAVAFVSGLAEPRGLVWDRDNTVFVADKAQNAVFSFPAGRYMADAPLTKGVEFAGAYGIALLSDQDDAFKNRKSSAHRLASLSTSLLGLLVCIFTFGSNRG